LVDSIHHGSKKIHFRRTLSEEAIFGFQSRAQKSSAQKSVSKKGKKKSEKESLESPPEFQHRGARVLVRSLQLALWSC
jgi:hypothetical protein